MLILSAPVSKLPQNMKPALNITVFLPKLNLRFLTQIHPQKIKAFFLVRIFR